MVPALKKEFTMLNSTKDENRSHVISFNSQIVTCYDHSDESVIELVKRYYEGKYNLACEVVNKLGKIIYKTS